MARFASATARRHARVAMAAALLFGMLGAAATGKALFIRAKAVLAQVLLERAFAASLVSGRTVKPWRWADTWPVARLTVPRLGTSAIVLEGESGQGLAFGPAHLSATPLPGEVGMSVIAGHRDTHFDFLGQLRIGDEIRVQRIGGVQASFRIVRFAVAPWDASGIDVDSEGHWLVLATCWPLKAMRPGPLRYLVYAK